METAITRSGTNLLGKCVAPWALAWLIALTVTASEYSEEWGPAIGSAMPAITALDQSGETRELGSLAGTGGLLFLVVRSADW